MRGWAVAAAVLLLLLLIGQVRVGVRGEYSGEGLYVWIRLGAVRVKVLPMAAKKKKPKQPRSGKDEQPTPPKGEKPKRSVGGALDYARALLPILLEAAGQFCHKLRMDVLRLELRTGAQDPADAALLYGQASAVLGALWYPLTQAFHVVDGSAKVEPDLDGGAMSLYAQASLSIKIWQVLWLGIYFGTKSLRAIFTVKEERKNKGRKAA